jgi:hypothetical protein
MAFQTWTLNDRDFISTTPNWRPGNLENCHCQRLARTDSIGCPLQLWQQSGWHMNSESDLDDEPEPSVPASATDSDSASSQADSNFIKFSAD